ncbi:MAG: hypothetical protein R3B70_18635 [Polyangiaceae bacterium]
MILRTIDSADMPAHRAEPLDDETVRGAASIVDDARGWEAVTEHAVRLGDARARASCSLS